MCVSSPLTFVATANYWSLTDANRLSGLNLSPGPRLGADDPIYDKTILFLECDDCGLGLWPEGVVAEFVDGVAKSVP